MSGPSVVLVDAQSRRMVVLRDAAPPTVVVAGFPGPPGTGGMTQAQADARYLKKTTLSGATAIQVVDALPAAPDADTIYITTS